MKKAEGVEYTARIKMKVVAVVVATLVSAFVWLGARFVAGRAKKLAAVADEFRQGAAHPGAAAVRNLSGCGLAAVLDSRTFWDSSPDLRRRFPVARELPPTLVLCGVRKHAPPPTTESVAEAYARAVESPRAIVVVVMRQRLGEEMFEAEVFAPASS
jgi:hypothetical protein